MIANKVKSIQLKFLSVYCGDAILIKYRENDTAWRNILTDGGFVKTYKSILKPELMKIVENGETIGLTIVTHYDADHIGGIIKMINDPTINCTRLIETWWVNCDLPLSDGNGLISVSQLTTLKSTLMKHGKFPTAPILTTQDPFEIYGATVTVLSPTIALY